MNQNTIKSSSEDVIKVIFTKANDSTKVSLHQTYNGNVYVGDSLYDTNKRESSVFVFVLDSIRASFSAARAFSGELLTNATGAKNEILAGREVDFTSTSVGSPTAYRWVLSRKDGYESVQTAANPVFKFYVPGLYDIACTATNEFGSHKIAYEDYIEVVGSTDPVTLDAVERSAENEISLIFSRAMQDPSECPISAFTIDVSNGGTEISVNVTALSAFENVVKLTLDDNIYNSDIINVSYDAAVGNLITADGMLAASSTDVPLVFSRRDVFKEIGFDGSVENSENTNWPYAWWGGQWEKYNTDNNVTTTKAYEGSKSLYFDMQAGGGAILDYRDNQGNTLNAIPVVEGTTYEGSLWLYIEEIGTEECDFLWMLPNNGWGTLMGVWLSGEETIGEWQKFTWQYTATATEDLLFNIRGSNENNSSSSLKIYIDNMKFEEIENRP